MIFPVITIRSYFSIRITSKDLPVTIERNKHKMKKDGMEDRVDILQADIIWGNFI